MEPPRLSLKRALLLSAVLALGVLAQDSKNNNKAPTQTTTQGQDNAATTANPQPAPTRTETTQTTTPTDSSSDTNSPTPTTSTSESSLTLPQLSTDSSTSVLTGLPKLSKTVPVATGIPTYPPPTIPPTQNAPFMNHSTLPDGTVFIAVGAILGAFGVAVLAWRGIVACLLHRSVERAALAQHAANNNNSSSSSSNGRRAPGDKKAASFPAPPAQFYRYMEREPSASPAAAGLAGSSSGLRKTHRGATPSSTPSQANLFFSPTAAGSSPSAGGSSANRDPAARFLPSGFYASTSSPTPGGHHGNSISMSTLRPSSRGGGAGPSQPRPSPPPSPSPTGTRVVSRNFSTSELNLNRPPSAYLDDLLDDQPGQFPPYAGPAGNPSLSPQGHGQGHGSQGRRY